MGKPIGVALLGLGTVGSGVARTLHDRADEFAEQVGAPIVVRGALVRDASKPREAPLPREAIFTEPDKVLSRDDVDIVVEMIGGEDPPFAFMRRALELKRYVVTANKEVMAKHGPLLLDMAREAGTDILFEASVGGGIPLISPLRRDLLANRISSVRAIINGTTNYILTRMAQEGADFADVLADAQRLGYAEPDPTNDVEGYDAAYKLAIMSSLAFRTRVAPTDVHTEGITRLTARDFRYAAELGYAIKLLAIGETAEGGFRARVHPVLIPVTEPLAKVDGVYNAVQLEGDLTGRVMFQGRGAGSEPTASAVVADVLDICHSLTKGFRDRVYWRQEAKLGPAGMDGLESRYYLRTIVADQPGVLAQLAGVLGEQGISIAAVIQKEVDDDARTAELIVMTHLAREQSMQEALRQLDALPVISEIASFVRVETGDSIA